MSVGKDVEPLDTEDGSENVQQYGRSLKVKPISKRFHF